ncbi:MAG: pyridoxamine 5'-phosphate oxidase [Alphaproteobacteria bacterium]
MDSLADARHKNPFAIFAEWYADAQKTESNDPNAMGLSTVDAAGRITSRMVLLKDFSEKGFVFYSHQKSDKGKALADNPKAALLFHWKTLRRQIRIEGMVSQIKDEEVDVYFHSRSIDSQIGAWASAQSSIMAHPDDLKKSFLVYQKKFAKYIASGKIPRPDDWCGWCLVATRIEFWQDRPHRLHDRLVFIKNDKGFHSEILYP